MKIKCEHCCKETKNLLFFKAWNGGHIVCLKCWRAVYQKDYPMTIIRPISVDCPRKITNESEG